MMLYFNSKMLIYKALYLFRTNKNPIILNLKQNYLIYLIILTGLVLRLIFPGDMEWKVDEKWMYEKAHLAVQNHELPAVGMQSGGGLVNPGLSLGVFALIAEFTSNPLQMNLVVQVVNIVAILCFLFFALYKIDEKERSVWLWGIALAAVSPLAVLFSRKIWAQDLLPMFSFLIILGNHYRSKPWGAFVWGLFGALIGQIHMSGFFFAAGLFLFSLAHDYFNHIKFRWFWWLLGSLLGSITLLTWIHYMLLNPQFTRQSFLTIFQFSFFFYWFIDSQGMNLMYSLRTEFWQFLKEPFINGMPTYLVAAAHLFLLIASIFTLMKLGTYFRKIFLFFKMQIPFRTIFINLSITKFYLYSILLGLGVMMTLSATAIQPHYLICAFPFMYIFLAKILQQRRRLLLAIIVMQLFLTLNFLMYVHKHNGISNGDYGVSYNAQKK